MKAVVIGGGIGGLATAIALQQKGIETDVYEAAPELQPVGKGIWVPNPEVFTDSLHSPQGQLTTSHHTEANVRS